MKIAILYDGGAHDWTTQDIRGVLEPVNAVRQVLHDAGHDVVKIAVQPDLAWVEAVRGVDLVFNLCEGVGGLSHLEHKVAGVLDLLGVPYTGASAWTMMVCHRKPVLNAVLAAQGLPVPPWIIPDGRGVSRHFPLPAIVKPAGEDASVGIDQGSVVTSRDTMAHRVAWVRDHFGEPMVQAYVDGREFNVGFVGDDVLPLSEIDFRAMPDGAWNIVTFAAKWAGGSAEDAGTQPVCPAKVEPALARQIVDLARAAWNAVHGRGYGRVDMRVDRDGRPWILEVNPNPDISTDAGLANMARARGWSYGDLVLAIVDAALAPAATPPSAIARVSASAEKVPA